MAYLAWDDPAETSVGGKTFFKFKQGPNTIRFVLKPMKRVVQFKGQPASTVNSVVVLDLDVNPPVAKIMDLKKSIYAALGGFVRTNSIDPGGKDAPAFVIERRGTTMEDTRYTTTPKQAPWVIPTSLYSEIQERQKELAEMSEATTEKLEAPVSQPVAAVVSVAQPAPAANPFESGAKVPF